MRAFPRPVAVTVLLLSALLTQSAQASVSFCEFLLSGIQQAHRQYKHGNDGVWVHDALEPFGTQALHPDRRVRRKLFEHILEFNKCAKRLVSDSDQTVKTLVEYLHRLAPEELQWISAHWSTQDIWHFDTIGRFLNTLLDSQPAEQKSAIEVKYTWLQGWRVRRDTLAYVLELTPGLRDQGIVTTPIPLIQENGARTAVLRVESIQVPQELQHRHALLQSFLLSERMPYFLTKIKRQRGAMIIDPWLKGTGTMAYFHQLSGVHPSQAQWVLVFQPDANTATFEHEWKHKVDTLVRQDLVQDQLVLARQAGRTQEDLGFLAAAGHEFESIHWDEVLATRHELELLAPHVSPAHAYFESALQYHRSSLRGVAVGRIFQEPWRWQHYWLWLRSWFVRKPLLPLP